MFLPFQPIFWIPLGCFSKGRLASGREARATPAWGCALVSPGRPLGLLPSQCGLGRWQPYSSVIELSSVPPSLGKAVERSMGQWRCWWSAQCQPGHTFWPLVAFSGARSLLWLAAQPLAPACLGSMSGSAPFSLCDFDKFLNLSELQYVQTV
jgi:hypothetical protein